MPEIASSARLFFSLLSLLHLCSSLLLQDSCSSQHLLSPKNDLCALSIDDVSASETDSYYPWDFPPVCVQPENKSKTSPKYCVYTSTSFRNGEGLSLITTPEIAASLLPVLDDASVSAVLRDHASSPYSASGNDPEEYRRNYEREDTALPYEITDVPHKGKGVLARTKIKRWQTAMVDFPAVIAPADLFQALSTEQGRLVIENAMERLPDAKKWAILRLAAGKEGGLVQSILNTNSFGVELEGVQHIALFTEASRVNHDCRPNVYWRYTSSALATEFVALRDIKPGDEIVYSYAPLGMVRDERREILKQWEFECECALCSASQGEVARSDQSRRRLQEVYAQLQEPKPIRKGRLAKLAVEVARLVREEDLEPQLVVAYELLARAYTRAGGLEKARMYVDLAEETWIRYGGVEHEGVGDVRRLREELSEAERHNDE